MQTITFGFTAKELKSKRTHVHHRFSMEDSLDGSELSLDQVISRKGARDGFTISGDAVYVHAEPGILEWGTEQVVDGSAFRQDGLMVLCRDRDCRR